MTLFFEIKQEAIAWYMAVRRVCRHYPRMAVRGERESEELNQDRRQDWEAQIGRRLSKKTNRGEAE